MKTKILKLVAKIATVATILSSVASFVPARAAAVSNIKDTMSRLNVSQASVNHVLTGTMPSGTWDNTETVTFTYTGFTAFAGTPNCTIGTGTCTASAGSTNVLTVTCTAVGGCSGALSVGSSTPYTGTNPGTAGSKTVSVGGSGGITGTFAVTIVDSDQVSVTASVDPSITFDLDTVATDGCSTTESGQPYSVALGTITTSDVRVSGSTDGVNSICIDLSTNASGGAVVTVANANGTSGLVSTSVPADDIDNSAATMAAGTENYGLCVASVGQTAGGPLAKAAPYDTGTCTVNGNTNAVKTLSTTPTNILNTTSLPIDTARAQVLVQAAISALQPAHSDYTDTLTFVATGTF